MPSSVYAIMLAGPAVNNQCYIARLRAGKIQYVKATEHELNAFALLLLLELT